MTIVRCYFTCVTDVARHRPPNSLLSARLMPLFRPLPGAPSNRFGAMAKLLARRISNEAVLDALDEPRALVDEPGIKLQQGRARLDLGDRRGTGIDAANAD